MDLTPLRDYRQYRLLFGSGLVTGLGSAATFVAMPFQVADITGSYVAVGVLGLLAPIGCHLRYSVALRDAWVLEIAL